MHSGGSCTLVLPLPSTKPRFNYLTLLHLHSCCSSRRSINVYPSVLVSPPKETSSLNRATYLIKVNFLNEASCFFIFFVLSSVDLMCNRIKQKPEWLHVQKSDSTREQRVIKKHEPITRRSQGTENVFLVVFLSPSPRQDLAGAMTTT